MKHSTIFKSRYWALLWAAGVIWFALDMTAPDAPADGNNAQAEAETDAAGAPVKDEDVKKLAGVIEGM